MLPVLQGRGHNAAGKVLDLPACVPGLALSTRVAMTYWTVVPSGVGARALVPGDSASVTTMRYGGGASWALVPLVE